MARRPPAVRRGADTNLFEAAALGLVAEVERHIAVNEPIAQTITSSFWGACHGGHIATAVVLLEAGAEINSVGYDDLTHSTSPTARKHQPSSNGSNNTGRRRLIPSDPLRRSR